MKTKKVIICGLGENHSGGVGRLLAAMQEEILAHEYQKIFTYTPKSLHGLLHGRKFLGMFFEISRLIIGRLVFTIKILGTRECKVLIIHPKSIGPSNLRWLLRHNEAKILIVDSSFFCIKSYNNYTEEYTECIRCLGQSSMPPADCMPFPQFPVCYSRRGNLRLINLLRNENAKLEYFTTCESNRELLLAHDPSINVANIGFPLWGILEIEKNGEAIEGEDGCYDYVFHGGLLIAKGILFFVELALHFRDRTFFIPSPRESVQALIKNQLPQNVECRALSWETGLRNIVEHARTILVPSIWSAAVEGALIKSLYFNGNVAVVKNRYSYTHDLPDNLVIALVADPVAAVVQLKREEDETLISDRRLAVRKWFDDNNDYFKPDLLFE